MVKIMTRLQKQCNAYKNVDRLADWVLFAVSRYINTGRATRQFELQFVRLKESDLLEMIKYCLNRDKSDDGIIKSVKRFVRIYVNGIRKCQTGCLTPKESYIAMMTRRAAR